jgi:hypothetical protein
MYVGEVYSANEQKTFTMYADTVDRAAAFKAMVKIRAKREPGCPLWNDQN